MDKKDFARISAEYSDQAWSAALLFECLNVAYSALARGRQDEFEDALLKLNSRPKDDDLTIRIRGAFETVCDEPAGEIAGLMYEAIGDERWWVIDDPLRVSIVFDAKTAWSGPYLTKEDAWAELEEVSRKRAAVEGRNLSKVGVDAETATPMKKNKKKKGGE